MQKKISFLRIGLLFCLGVLIISCGRTRPACPSGCQLGEKRCSADKNAIDTCQKTPTGNCFEWIQTNCGLGNQCTTNNGVPSCGGGGVCPTSCQAGTFKCEGTTSHICQKDPTGSCNKWFAQQTCGVNSVCEPTSGLCRKNNCTPVNLQAQKKCVGNAIYWFDDCGNQAQVAKQCAAQQTCTNAQCITQSCQPKNPQTQKKCVGNAIYWFDDCGKQGSLAAQCKTGQICSNGQCSAPSGCQGTHACGIGTTQCQGNAVQSCAVQANSCRGWGTATPCSTGMKCENGRCIQDNTGTKGPVGSPCTSGTQCAGGGCLQWPNGYCTKQCQSSCPSGSICAGLQTNQGTINVCLKQCTSNAQCRSGYACYQNKICVYTGNTSSGCKRNTDCPSGQTCNTSNGTCVQPGCTSNAQCTGGNVCKNGACVSPPCTSNSNCPSGQTCQNGICKGNGSPGTPGLAVTRKITIGGVTRSYILYVGKGYTGTRKAPVILGFHGYGDSASNYLNTSNWKSIADQHGIVFVALDKPATGGQKSGYWEVTSSTGPDAVYADAVLKEVQKNHNTDSKRLYAVGFSQGGYFLFRYGLSRASTFAALAIQSASRPGNLPAASRKIAVIFVIGTLDSAYSRVKTDYQNLKNAGHPVKLIELAGQGHCCAALKTKNADVWTFFQSHPKP